MARDNFSKKFGTPFDPMGGKVQREQAQRDQERREQEQHKLRGCGDPNCAMCNPETAARGGAPAFASGGVVTGRWGGPRNGESERYRPITDPSGRYSITLSNADGRMSDSYRTFQQALMRRMADAIGESLTGQSLTGQELTRTKSEPPKRRPPASYQEAREAVKDWIVPVPEQAFDDIVGNEAALALLRDAISAPVTHKELYEAYGMKPPKGALLSGPPGCGKTMFAKAAVSEMRKLYGEATEFISISGASIQSPYVGVTEGYILAVFAFAREYKAYHGHPLLVFIDEAEVLLPDRTGRVRRVAPWEESQVATFLSEMDGMQESGAFVMLATNRPEVIDQAVLRDGRCDFKIVVERPTREAAKVIMQKGFEALPLRGAGVAELTFAAEESLYDPALVLAPFRLLEIENGTTVRDLGGRDFLLEHIVSGAIAASIPERAKRIAFTRDKTEGTKTGVKVDDVIAAVRGVFEENKGLQHQFALNEFLSAFAKEVPLPEPKPKPRKMN